jgi:hypothetical protein
LGPCLLLPPPPRSPTFPTSPPPLVFSIPPRFPLALLTAPFAPGLDPSPHLASSFPASVRVGASPTQTPHRNVPRPESASSLPSSAVHHLRVPGDECYVCLFFTPIDLILQFFLVVGRPGGEAGPDARRCPGFLAPSPSFLRLDDDWRTVARSWKIPTLFTREYATLPVPQPLTDRHAWRHRSVPASPVPPCPRRLAPGLPAPPLRPCKPPRLVRPLRLCGHGLAPKARRMCPKTSDDVVLVYLPPSHVLGPFGREIAVRFFHPCPLTCFSLPCANSWQVVPSTLRRRREPTRRFLSCPRSLFWPVLVPSCMFNISKINTFNLFPYFACMCVCVCVRACVREPQQKA